jgi:Rod binding domain-containing protein
MSAVGYSSSIAQTPAAQAALNQAKAAVAKTTAASSVKGATPAQLKSLAGDFESSFISSMLQPMFAGLSTAAPFGGGQGEEMFKSFLVDAVAKQMTKSGGLGMSGALQKEFMKMQASGGHA